jgi:hypothetical protein
VQVPDSAVTAEPGAGLGRVAARDLAMPDYFNIPNALFRFMDPTSVPATVSYDLRWKGPVTERRRISDATAGFRGEFFGTAATMWWSARTATFAFTSDAASTSHSVAALLGTERNGRFFLEA